MGLRASRLRPCPTPLRRVLSLAATLLLVARLTDAAPAGSGLSMTVQPGFGGYGKLNRWLPVRIGLVNNGPTIDVEARATFAVYGRGRAPEYCLPAQLPGPSQRRYHLYVLPTGLYSGGPVLVNLLQEERRLAGQTASVRWVHPPDRLVVMIDPGQGALGALAGRQMPTPGERRGVSSGTVHVAYLKPEEAPERALGYEAVDLLVLGKLSDRAFTGVQRTALVQWVETGGAMVINGGPDAAALRALFPAGRRRAGRVHHLAFDLTRSGYRDAERAPTMFEQMLRASRRPTFLEILGRASGEFDSTYGGRYDSALGAIGSACYELAQLDPPNAGLVVGYLLAYILCLVPINYAVLSRRDRRELAWVTTPAIVAAFTLLAFGMGYGLKGGRILLARTGIIETWAGASVGDSRSTIGLFSPRKTRYDLAVEEPTALLAASATEDASTGPKLVQEETIRAVGAEVDMWSMRLFRADLPLALGRGIGVRWTGRGEVRDAVITNDTPYDLEECVLFQPYQYPTIPVGRLSRGAKRSVDQVHRGPIQLSFSEMAEKTPMATSGGRMRRAVLRALARTSYPLDTPVLVGWIRRPPFPVTVNGREAEEENAHLVMVHLE